MPERQGAVRTAFAEHLAEIERLVDLVFGLMIEGVAGATHVLLTNDLEAAEALAARDQDIDDLEQRIEAIVEQVLLLESPVASDFRFLMTVVRIVPELERTADLAEHIAVETSHGFGAELTPALRGIAQDMGDSALDMWRRAFDAFRDRDASAAAELDEADDRLDNLRDRFVETAARELGTEWMSNAALIGRYFERIGDHAVNIARRVEYLAVGRPTD